MKKINKTALTESQRNKRFYDNHREDELARNKEYYLAYYEKNGEAIRLRRRCYHHGCTPKWLGQKRIEQNNCCAICTQVFMKTPHIDHDHGCCPSDKRYTCGNCNRDLLCDDCNLGLGRFKDNIEFLSNAIQYLRRHNETIPNSGQ